MTQENPRFSENEYLHLMELITIKKTITLDCDKEKPYDEEYFDDENNFITLAINDVWEYYGNVTSSHVETMPHDEQQKWVKKRFRTFVQDTGEIGLEISFLPGPPMDIDYDEKEHLKTIYDNTRLSELITLEEFIEDFESNDPWIYECFGDKGETYGLIIDAVAPKFKNIAAQNYEPLLEKPLWIQYKGKKFQVHIHEWSD